MIKPPDLTQPRKKTSSVIGSTNAGRAFGEPPAPLPPIDSLAMAGPAYNADVAYLLAVISTWAYADEHALADKLRYYGLPGAHVRRITVQNDALLVATTAYLIQSPSGKVAVLAFRGTDPANLIPVLTDTQVMQQPFYGTRVHAGFHASVEVVWDDLHRALLAARAGEHLGDENDNAGRKRLPNRLQALFVTGHSLGGAMAVLAAARLCRPDYAEEFPSALIRGVYTYGQPMVGDRAFANACEKAFGGRWFRHVFHNDVVPRLPPRSSLDYAHGGPELRSPALDVRWAMTRKSSERVDLPLAAISVIVQAIGVRTSARELPLGPSIDDHSPANYFEVSRYALAPETGVLVPEAPFLVRAAEFIADRLDEAENTVRDTFGRAVNSS